MPWNLLLLPLLGGFAFLNLCHYFRYRFQRYEGYRLLMSSAIVGVALLVVARLITFLAVKTSIGHWINLILWNVVPFPFIGTAMLSFALGVIAPALINWRLNEENAKSRAVYTLGDPLVQLLFDAAERRRAVFLTLASRKVYVGFVQRSPNLESDNVNVALSPLLSGYRDPATLRTKFVVDYGSVYSSDTVDPKEFQVVVPVAQIQSAHYFNQKIYAKFFSERGPVPEQTATDPSGLDPH